MALLVINMFTDLHLVHKHEKCLVFLFFVNDQSNCFYDSVCPEMESEYNANSIKYPERRTKIIIYVEEKIIG